MRFYDAYFARYLHGTLTYHKAGLAISLAIGDTGYDSYYRRWALSGLGQPLEPFGDFTMFVLRACRTRAMVGHCRRGMQYFRAIEPKPPSGLFIAMCTFSLRVNTQERI